MRFSSERGALAGIVGAMFAYYVCWHSSLLVSNIECWIFGMKIGSLGGPPIDLILGLFAMLLYTFYSYLFVGWLTISSAAGMGWLFTRAVAKRMR